MKTPMVTRIFAVAPATSLMLAGSFLASPAHAMSTPPKTGIWSCTAKESQYKPKSLSHWCPHSDTYLRFGTWTSWTSSRATADGNFVVWNGGNPQNYRAKFIFKRPRRYAPIGRLYSRLTIRFLQSNPVSKSYSQTIPLGFYNMGKWDGGCRLVWMPAWDHAYNNRYHYKRC